jgi:multidrug efflux pump subunit AcrA (membrane-fusion protein)
MNKRRIVLVLVAVLIVAGAVLLVRHRKQQLASIRIAKTGAVPVRMGTVGRDLFIGTRIYFGVLTSNRRADVRARTGGQVSRVLKWEATPVEKGEALIELDGVNRSTDAASCCTSTRPAAD